MLKKLLVIATLAAGLISTQASAAFVSTDWKVAGDKGAVLDEDTGIEWLNLKYSDKKSVATVVSELGSVYKGWRLPTNAEVEAFVTKVWGGLNVQIHWLDSRFGGYHAGAHRWIDLMSDGFKHTATHAGMYYDEDGLIRMVGSYSNEGGAYTNTFGLEYSPVYTVNSVINNYMSGVLLVSDGGTTLSSINDPTLNINNPNAPINMADVSAPLGLAGAGLLMIMLGGRRKAV